MICCPPAIDQDMEWNRTFSMCRKTCAALNFGTGGAHEHGRLRQPEDPGDLHQQETDAPGRGVDQRGLPRLERMAVAGQILRGEPLEQQGGGGLRGDVVRERDQLSDLSGVRRSRMGMTFPPVTSDM